MKNILLIGGSTGIGYELSKKDRTVLVIEFSDPNKHKILSQGLLKGPIGTDKNNQFKLKEIENIPHEINYFLDKQRMSFDKNIVIYK